MDRFADLTIEDLERAIEIKRQAEEALAREEEAKREKELDELRLSLLDTAIQYLLKLGAISEKEVAEMDVTQTLEELKAAEGALLKYSKLIGLTKVNVMPGPDPLMDWIRVNLK